MCNYKSLWFHYDTSTSPKGKKGLPLNHWRMGINPTPYIGFLSTTLVSSAPHWFPSTTFGSQHHIWFPAPFQSVRLYYSLPYVKYQNVQAVSV